MGQDEKILEWLGIKGEPYVHDTYGEFGGRVTGTKYPVIDLNFLFKYAVPKLDDYTIHRYGYNRSEHYVGIFQGGTINYSAHDKDPVEAFKQALIKIIKEERK